MRYVSKPGLVFFELLSLCGCATAKIQQMKDMHGIYLENPVFGVHGYYVRMENVKGIGFDVNDKQSRDKLAEEYVGDACQSPSVVGERVVDEAGPIFVEYSPP